MPPPSCAYFRLTDGGLELIRACREVGFHPHPLTDTDMYQVCARPAFGRAA
jgi:hypothetical protein